MGQFIHEIIIDSNGTVKEEVKINGMEFALADFQSLEPGYAPLPAGVKGFQYFQGREHFAFDMEGNAGMAFMNETLLDGYIANCAAYQSALSENAWDTGTVLENQQKRIAEIKKEARQKFQTETDWYIVRQAETGTPVPQAVIDYRSAMRQAVADAETAIAGLSSVGEIKSAGAVWPAVPGGV